MTRKDESAPAGTDASVPPTRRSRRDGEREAEHRALYVDRPEQASPMRVVDGGAPMYRTRREMRESASRIARDLPVIVEPVIALPADAATGDGAPADDAPADVTLAGRRALRMARTAEQPAGIARAAEDAAPAAAAGPRRARRAATAPSAPDLAEQRLPSEPFVAAATTSAQPEPAASVADARAAEQVETTIVAVEQDDLAATSVHAVEAPPEPEPAEVRTASEAPAAERLMTRTERRAAQAASSDEVSAAVAAVLGSEQEDAASTPVRSPLRREARPPRPAGAVGRRPAALAPVVRPSRRARSSAARRAVQRLGAAGVILAIGSFVAVTSLPAQALSPTPSAAEQAYGDVQVEQELDVTSGTGAHGDEEVTAVLGREDFNVDDEIASTRLDADELGQLQAVADTDEIGPYYDGEPSMPNVWSQLETNYTQSPFPSLAEVPVSSGFGYRWGSFHGGVDLIPGAGTPVYPIANGVVVAVWQGNNPGGGGYEVIVEHNIDGEFFQSWYPHMQAGSILVEEGQVVDISTQLGAVGSTGRSTGAHLHLEIKNGDYISVDPLVWLATREQILEP